MFTASINLHNVTKVTQQRTIFPNFVSIKFTLTNDLGADTEITAFLMPDDVKIEVLEDRDFSKENV